jgi:hypothetical protein
VPDYLSQEYFKKITAHELGHILGIDDAYPSKDGVRPDASIGFNARVSKDDLMHTQFNSASPLSGWDLAMALQAFTESKWQYWKSYDTNKQSVIIVPWNCSK